MANLVRVSKVRFALVSSILAVASVAASDEECTKLVYDDHVEASLGRDGDVDDIDATEPPTVSVEGDTLAIVWSRDARPLTLTVDLPAREEGAVHRVEEATGELCEGSSCAPVEGAIILLEASETCSTSLCDDGFRAVFRGHLEDGRLLVVEVSRGLDTEPTSCNSCCGSGGLLFI